MLKVGFSVHGILDLSFEKIVNPKFFRLYGYISFISLLKMPYFAPVIQIKIIESFNRENEQQQATRTIFQVFS